MATKAFRVVKAPKDAKDVYRGYMPIGLPQHKPRNRIKPWWKIEGKPRVTLYPKQPIEGYTETPEYPQLNDGSRKGVKNQVRYDWYEKLKSLPTVESKMYEISRHQEHFIAHINSHPKNYTSLPMAQYLTQTNLLNCLPQRYETRLGENETIVGEKNSDKRLVEQVKQIILEQIALDRFETLKTRQMFLSKSGRNDTTNTIISSRSVQNLVNGVKKLLALEANPQLLDYHYDLSPALRSWWYHSGFQAPNNKVFYRSRKDTEGRINQMIQLDGSAALSIRTKSLIEPILEQNDPSITDLSQVQNFSYPLKDYGAQFKFAYPVALSGYWYDQGADFNYPHTCFLTTSCLEDRQKSAHKVIKPLDDHEDCLTGQAILSAFGWLNTLSMYQGFTPFHEVTYPLTCQVVTTDGQNWLFNVYQFNCNSFHRDLGGPKMNNVCWTSGKMQLFEEHSNGEFKNVNDEVVNLLIKFLCQKDNPEYTSQINLNPYLGEDNRTEEEKSLEKVQVRKKIEQRRNLWLRADWRVPLWEHIFFRSKIMRYKINHMKPRWHLPKPEISKFFD